MNKQINYYLTTGAIIIFSLLTSTARLISGTISVYDCVPGVQTDTNASIPRPQFIFINKHDATTTGINFKCTATPDNGTITDYQWYFAGGSPSSSTVQNPGTVQFSSITELDSKSCNLGVTHKGSAPGNQACADKSKVVVNVQVVVPQIDPDSGQTGVIGDIVPSNKTDGTGERHFVSPKATSSDYVTLVANVPGVTSSNFGILLEWDTSAGTSVSGSPNKWRVSRGTAGKFTVKLNRVNDHTEVARINVWIVWSTITSTAVPVTSLVTSTGTSIDAGYNFTHTIAPAGIITDTDHPDLTGANATAPPSVPSSETTVPNAGVDLSGGADHKWDNTRRIKRKIINPDNIDFSAYTHPDFYVTRPAFPSNSLAGNDDQSTVDEDNDIYGSGHQGTLLGGDDPTTVLLQSSGAVGDTVEKRGAWQEFTRLEINSKWYIISDAYPWHVYFKFSKVHRPAPNNDDVWDNNGSSEALDNAGF